MYRVGIVGLGRIGFLLDGDSLREKPASHVGAVSMHGSTDLVCACDLRKDRRLLFEERYGFRAYEDYRELLLVERLDILVVATDVSSHCEVVKAAAGIRVIICEKPLSDTLSGAREMLEVCERAGTVLVVNHERRFSSDYIFVKGLIDAGRIGDLRSIKGTVVTMDSSVSLLGGGVLMNDGTHLLDMFRFFSGSEVLELSAFMGDVSSGFCLSGLIRMENGVLCTLESSGMRDYFSFALELCGDRGRIDIGNGILRYYRSFESSYYDGFRDLREEVLPEFSYGPQLYNVVDSVVRYLDGELSVISSLGLDAYRSLEIIFALYASVFRGDVIRFPFRGLGDFPEILSGLDSRFS